MENNQACMKEVKLAASFKREILKLENCNSVDTKSTLDSEHSNKSVSKIIWDKKGKFLVDLNNHINFILYTVNLHTKSLYYYYI